MNEQLKKLLNTAPAFPVNIDLGDEGEFHHPGMTLLDYFAVRAPEVPHYFKPVIPDSPVPVYRGDNSDLTSLDINVMAKRFGDCFYMVNAKEIEDWEILRLEQTQIQWRWHYAELMIKARKK
jgi:hypothetical protein